MNSLTKDAAGAVTGFARTAASTSANFLFQPIDFTYKFGPKVIGATLNWFMGYPDGNESRRATF